MYHKWGTIQDLSRRSKGLGERRQCGRGKSMGSWAMDIKPIKTEANYGAALEEIDRLLDAEPDTPDGVRLDVLTTLVQAWEQQHHQIEDPETA